MFENSIIITAHPDDEILWFSSILEKVNEVAICFLDCRSKPNLSIGRQKSLLAHPIKNISCFSIDESETFNSANWHDPLITQFGIEISDKNISDKKYRGNYYKLKQHLKDKLIGYHNVFTHNPWGEYGHEEHVQVYRVVKEVQKEMRYDLWFSNYCSNSSFKLMLSYISGFDSEYVTLGTNKNLSSTVKELYKKNGCWTWYDDWEWFNEESFMKDRDYTDGIKTYGHVFPLNMIKFDPFISIEANSRSNSKQNSPRNFIFKIIKHTFKKHEKNN
jgi:hypothetical protein